MSQKTNIENLNSILETVNSLPDAGSGGSGSTNYELCTVTIVNTPAGYNLVWHTIENDEVMCKTACLPISLSLIYPTISVIKGSYIVIGISTFTNISSNITLTGGLEIVDSSINSVGRVLKVTGDGSIEIK